MKTVIITFLLGLCSLSYGDQKNSSNKVYWGGSLGISVFNNFINSGDLLDLSIEYSAFRPGTIEGFSEDDNDVSMQIGVGVLGPNKISFEVFYTDLGDVSGNLSARTLLNEVTCPGCGFSEDTVFTISGKTKTHGVGIKIAKHISLGKSFSLAPEIGVLSWKGTASYQSSKVGFTGNRGEIPSVALNTSRSGSVEVDGNDFLVGLTALYGLSEKHLTYFGWNMFKVDEYDVNRVSVGIIWIP